MFYYRRAQIISCTSLTPSDRSWFIDDMMLLLCFWVSYILQLLINIKLCHADTPTNSTTNSSDVYPSHSLVLNMTQTLSPAPYNSSYYSGVSPNSISSTFTCYHEVTEQRMKQWMKIFISLGSILAVIRLLAYFKSADHLGPLLVSLKVDYGY